MIPSTHLIFYLDLYRLCRVLHGNPRRRLQLRQNGVWLCLTSCLVSLSHKRLPSMSTTAPLAFSTCDFCDVQKDDTTGAFRVLAPVFLHFGSVPAFSGRVSTVKCHEDNTLVKAALDSAGEGRVLVVDGGGSLRRALVGGNVAAAAARNGWAGIVVDGCVRDVAELQVLAVGIRALALIPLPTEKRGEGQRDVPVQIQGVWVHPGDWLYADADGMVVSAKALSE